MFGEGSDWSKAIRQEVDDAKDHLEQQYNGGSDTIGTSSGIRVILAGFMKSGKRGCGR
jgi:hypothetical protein